MNMLFNLDRINEFGMSFMTFISNFNINIMIVIIKSELNPITEFSEIDHFTPFLVPYFDCCKNELVRTDKSMSYFNRLTCFVSPYNVFQVYTAGIDTELLGITIGYLMVSGVMNIADNDELKKKIDFLLDGKMPDENDKKTFLIKKILHLGSCQFKKFNSIVSELKFEDTIEDYILDALMMFYGIRPSLKGENSVFVNALSKCRGLWA